MRRSEWRVTRAASFNHLVGAGEQRCWHVEAERFRFMPIPSARNDIVAAEIVILKGLGTIW